MNYYYCSDGNTVLGPVSRDELLRLQSTNQITPTTRVCAAGTQVWQPLASVLPPQASGVHQPPPPPPPTMRPVVAPENQGDSTGGIIPYKNPHALTAYYLGIFGLMPCIGILLAIPAIILGISGLAKRKRNPIIRGSVHAWIGIVLGAASLAYHALAVVLMMGVRR